MKQSSRSQASTVRPRGGIGPPPPPPCTRGGSPRTGGAPAPTITPGETAVTGEARRDAGGIATAASVPTRARKNLQLYFLFNLFSQLLPKLFSPPWALPKFRKLWFFAPKLLKKTKKVSFNIKAPKHFQTYKVLLGIFSSRQKCLAIIRDPFVSIDKNLSDLSFVFNFWELSENCWRGKKISPAFERVVSTPSPILFRVKPWPSWTI